MIEQRSKAWFEQRKGKITGSAVGAILGLSPFSKPSDVMRRMVREYHGAESEFEGNIATQYGQQNEPMAMIDFRMENGVEIEETGFHVHSEIEWLGASPDGFVNDDAVAEIKCPFSKRDSDEFKPLSDQPHYYAQTQIEMYCTGRSKCYFYQWSPVGTMLEVVEFDQSYIDEILPKLAKFYEQYLEEIKSPDKHLIPLTKTREAQALADEYHAAKEEADAANERLKAAKAALIKCADGHKSNISGVLVYPINKQGSISYAKVVKEHLPDLDLEQYRGKSSTSWGVK
ncbi:exonuclease [Vibrio phage pYD21-A]|uniref:exonuclease n=1 Tax=Vibrio phage pYD21-A TaxID=754049 RepID=UPI0002C12F90|nr:exonuclease [Vibrio phage pYD21-A]AGH16091.1 hypothetical protein VPKG_00054 [Vibrio phage pYD21-A]